MNVKKRRKEKRDLIKEEARERAKTWWRLPGRERGIAPQIKYGAVCDEYNRQIPVGEGYLIKFHSDGYI